MSEIKRGLFIGRFQPFHLGHLAVLKEMDCNSALEELIIGIGSWQYDYLHKKPEMTLKDNPFTGEERQEMISRVVHKRIQKHCHIIPIPDIHDYIRWVNYVNARVPYFDIVYAGNTIVRELMENEGIQVRYIKNTNLSGTMIRNMIVRGDETWKTLVPAEVVEYLFEIKGAERILILSKGEKTED